MSHPGLEVSFCRGEPGERVVEVRVEDRNGNVLVAQDNFADDEAARQYGRQLANDPVAKVHVGRAWWRAA